MDNKTMQPKCICVPSGMCHSHTLLGCPHKHYFNDKKIWTCVVEPSDQNKLFKELIYK